MTYSCRAVAADMSGTGPLTIHEDHIVHVHVINEVVVVHADHRVSAYAAADGESELVSFFKWNGGWQVAAANLRTLKEGGAEGRGVGREEGVMVPLEPAN